MKEQRWLLPFTHGVDTRALETVVRAADARGATLVPVALITVPPGGRSPGARLEHIQQAKDFLVVAQHIARRHQVSVEGHEAFTADVGKGIRQIIQDLHSDGLVLVTRKQQGVLLSTGEMTDLLLTPPASLILVRLPVQKQYKLTAHPLVRFISRLRAHHGQQDEKYKQREPVAVPEDQTAVQEEYLSPSLP
jgi:hypothetical protein